MRKIFFFFHISKLIARILNKQTKINELYLVVYKSCGILLLFFFLFKRNYGCNMLEIQINISRKPYEKMTELVVGNMTSNWQFK